jgi:CheY-like chemotaxis protein
MARKKILLVDDSNTTLLLEKMLLSRFGYDFVVARDGREGVALALSERPDLILLDMMMPKMDGLEACRQIRQESATASIPIIMVTTRSDAEDIETAFLKGCNDYIIKPINHTELFTKVRSLLGEAG